VLLNRFGVMSTIVSLSDIFFEPLHCLSFDLRIPIARLVSSVFFLSQSEVANSVKISPNNK
jgi:hypothetical protein